MKRTILTITAVAALLFASCGNNAKSAEGTASDSTPVAQEAAAEAAPSITGAWKLSDINLNMEIPKGKEQAFEDMKKKMLEATVYTFNEDGTMSFKNHMVKETSGTYTYENGKLIMSSDVTKKSDTASVDELSADKLVLTSQQGGKKATMTFSR